MDKETRVHEELAAILHRIQQISAEIPNEIDLGRLSADDIRWLRELADRSLDADSVLKGVQNCINLGLKTGKIVGLGDAFLESGRLLEGKVRAVGVRAPVVIAETGDAVTSMDQATSTTQVTTRPPQIVELLAIGLLLNAREREELVGNLEEDFHTGLVPKLGLGTARLVYVCRGIIDIVAIQAGKWRKIGGLVLVGKLINWISEFVNR